MLHAVMEVNDRRPKVLVSRLRALLGDLAGCKIAVLGIAFKPGTDDTRDSPAWKLIDELHAGGADVHVFDPVAAVPDDRRVTSAGSLCEAVRNATAVVLATAWPEFVSADWPALLSQMARPVVVDGRNALRHVPWPAGTQYISVGRA